MSTNKASFRLIGLNQPWKAGGFSNVYATVDRGNEDWFHACFDEQLFPADRLQALFSIFKDSEENLWHDRVHKVVVEGGPVHPVIKELILERWIPVP